MHLQQLTKHPRYAQLWVRKHLVVLFFAFIATLGLFQVSNFAAASLDFYFVQNIVDTWQQDFQNKTEDDYLRAKQALTDARHSHPNHPLYVDMSAQLYEWASLAEYEEPEYALQAAKAYYYKAIKMRPTWPVTYASLAMVKWRLGEFDDELVSILEKASHYGPQKAEVHILLVEMGLALYKANHPFYRHLREELPQRLSRGLRNYQSQARVKDAIQRTDSWRTVCRWLSKSDRYTAKNLLGCQID